MAGMKRFVTYIYSYEDKKKGSNIGFAKIEIRGEECRVEVHLRGIYARQMMCDIFLFREADGEMEGVRIGELRLLNGNGDSFVSIRAGRIGESTLGIHNMEGILLLGEDGQIYLSRWKEGKPIDVCSENFRVWQPQTAPRQVAEPRDAATEMPVQPEQTQKMPVQPEKSQEKPTPAEKPQDVPARLRQPQAADLKEDAVQATEIPMRNIFPNYDWESVWEGLKQSHILYHPFEDRQAECIQIELRHLRELPKRYWYLGNNSFLLHGFFNYQYLVVGKTGEGQWFLGVPGVYQKQERVMAAIFGFPEFVPMASAPGENEKNDEPINQFGCWLRSIEE